jgi:hypothetical protein
MRSAPEGSGLEPDVFAGGPRLTPITKRIAKDKPVSFLVRSTPELRTRAEAAAQTAGLSFNKWLVRLISQELEHLDNPEVLIRPGTSFAEAMKGLGARFAGLSVETTPGMFPGASSMTPGIGTGGIGTFTVTYPGGEVKTFTSAGGLIMDAREDKPDVPIFDFKADADRCKDYFGGRAELPVTDPGAKWVEVEVEGTEDAVGDPEPEPEPDPRLADMMTEFIPVDLPSRPRRGPGSIITLSIPDGPGAAKTTSYIVGPIDGKYSKYTTYIGLSKEGMAYGIDSVTGMVGYWEATPAEAGAAELKTAEKKKSTPGSSFAEWVAARPPDEHIGPF